MNFAIKTNVSLNKLDKSKPIVLALSGGVDSMVLFDLLIKADFSVIIAHVNHHKREQSTLEAKYIQEMGEKYKCKVIIHDYFHEANNFQAEAHNMRYDFFYNVAKENNATAIITAHHAIDNFETIIMNIIKGSNLYGYGGIKESSLYNDIPLIRPLINCSKDEIYDYATNNQITYFEDSSNKEDTYLRNRIRHHVYPLLLKENPNLLSSITNYSNQLFGAFDLIRNATINYWKSNGKIKIESFAKLATIQQKDIINYLFEENDITSSENKINDILELIYNSRPNLTYDLGNNYQFVKSYDECYVTENIATEEVYEEINLYDSVVIENYGNFFFRKVLPENSQHYIKISKSEKYPLIIRHRKHGDKLDINSGHKKLKDFLIDKKIPKDERDKILVVTNSADEIIWVIDLYQKKCEEDGALNFIFEEKDNG